MRARSVVSINAAPAVRCRSYARFAAYLCGHGLDAFVYDSRGIGASRPAPLRGFEASWVRWGRLDGEAVLRYAAPSCRGQPLYGVAHRVGGFVCGGAPRLLACNLRMAPEAIGSSAIGPCGCFHDRFAATLGPMARAWC